MLVKICSHLSDCGLVMPYSDIRVNMLSANGLYPQAISRTIVHLIIDIYPSAIEQKMHRIYQQKW